METLIPLIISAASMMKILTTAVTGRKLLAIIWRARWRVRCMQRKATALAAPWSPAAPNRPNRQGARAATLGSRTGTIKPAFTCRATSATRSPA